MVFCAFCNLLERIGALWVACCIVLCCAVAADAQGLMEPRAIAAPGAPINLDAPYSMTAAQPYVPMSPPTGAWIAPPQLPGQATYPMAPSPYGADPGWGQPVVP